MNWIQKIKAKRQIHTALKKNGIKLRNLKREMTDYLNRPLDIQEIVSREQHDNVVIDAYEYCMRKCNWDPSEIDDCEIKDFLLCILFDGEVDNGGISQFFYNSSGDLYEETLSALKKIKPQQAAILEQALECFPNGKPPKDRDSRIDILENGNGAISEQLDALDTLLYGSENNQDYYDYLMEHKDSFQNL